MTVLLLGCSPKSGDLIVAKIGETPVRLGEYEKFYNRNANGIEAAKKSTLPEREEFLNLLLKYKLKLQDAYDKNIESDPEIKQELAEYRSSLASTFLLEKELIEPNLKKLYDRSKEEIRASHILIRCEANASPEDSLKAYNKAKSIIDSLKNGISFEKLAVEFSEDPSVQQNKGDIYYFTSGQLVNQFEDAAYEMKIGEVYRVPVRTSFGYHIIKVTDRKKTLGSIRVRHIMTRFSMPNKPDSADSVSTYSRILAIRDSLKKGISFDSLAIKHSEDGGSAQSGGDLGYFSRRRWIQQFDEAAFKLKTGEVSGIVQTPYGFHILKCEDIKPVPSFDEMRTDIQKKFQSQRYDYAYSEFISELKRKLHYTFNESIFDNFILNLDSTKTTNDSAWAESIPLEVLSSTVIKAGERDIKIDSVIELLSKRQDFKGTNLRKSDLRNRLDRIGELVLIEEKSKNLEQKYPEFKSLMQEYEDGVILYKAEQMEIWNKLSITDSTLRGYFETNRDKFVFLNRVGFNEIFVKSDSLAQEISQQLDAGANFDTLAVHYNEESGSELKNGAHGLINVQDSELAQKAWEMEIGKISQPIKTEENGYSIIKVNAKDHARQKSFEEAGVEVSNAFQEYEQKRLEQEWLNRIKTKYPVSTFPEVLQKAFTE
jgi:peptidyl-prolyl cis-trans isomerase SurA